MAKFSGLDDPWDLPPFFLLRKNNWKSQRTYSGYWKEIEEECTAIRSAGESSPSSSPSYVGIRKTLVFYLNDGTKTDWICHDYYGLRKNNAGEALVLQEDVVLRKVFKRDNNETDHTSSPHGQVELCVKVYKEVSSCHEILSDLLKRIGGIHHKNTNQIDQLLGRTRSILESRNFPVSAQSVEALSIEISEILKETRSILAEDYHIGSFFGISSHELIQLVDVRIIQASESVNKHLGVLKKDLGAVPCDLEKKSENIWQHFTKICSENDPDEVYAVCHHCDKVLKVKAHPMKDDTSHLISHIHTCSSCTKSNPSTDEDREMLRRLRTVLDNPYEQQKLDCQDDLTKLDPWDLKRIHPTPWYVTRSLNRETHGGHWREINTEFTAIRMEDQLQMQRGWKDIDKEISGVQMDHQFQVQVPQYIGVRRILQFEPKDGTEMNWIMLEYQQLIIHDMESPALFLQGDMVIRKVFHYDRELLISSFIDLNRWLQSDDDSEEYYYKGEGVNIDSSLSSDYVHVEGNRKRKRNVSKRKSKVWVHLTEIRTADPDVVYAVCHHCDRGYGSACSKNGTSHLQRHTKSCSGKLPGTGNANSTEWEAVIGLLLELLKNYGETEH